jgi:hypothetical protein
MGSEWREEVASVEPIADPRILDLVHLRRYTMDNEALERELLALFANSRRSCGRSRKPRRARIGNSRSTR